MVLLLVLSSGKSNDGALGAAGLGATTHDNNRCAITSSQKGFYRVRVEVHNHTTYLFKLSPPPQSSKAPTRSRPRYLPFVLEKPGSEILPLPRFG